MAQAGMGEQQGGAETSAGLFLTFHLAGEDYGIPIGMVAEIVGLQKITSVPNMPDYVRGMINLRGRIVPVMDMRQRFGLESRDYDSRTCIVIVDIEGLRVGLVVDMVREVLAIPDSRIDTGFRGAGRHGDCLAGLGKTEMGVKILLELGRLFDEEERRRLARARQDLPSGGNGKA